jgi:uncharacterized protein YecE (DUF72 family)
MLTGTQLTFDSARTGMAAGELRIGISGWRYEPWRGRFYPPGLPQRQELAFASRVLPSVEINGSFYSLQTPASYQSWHDETPDDFVFSVKGPRYITHLLRIQGVREALANFMASGVFALRAKLGPMLWQFPERQAFDCARFDAFFSLLPRDTDAALALARAHDARVAGRTWLDLPRGQPLRHAVEIRHASFANAEFVALVRRHHIALVVADTAGRWPLLEDLSADFLYLRLHGDKELYASGYGDEALQHWARRIQAWSRGQQVDDARLASDRPAPPAGHRDVFCYFDNDIKVHAPYDAARLSSFLGLRHALDDQGRFVTPPGLLQKPTRRAADADPVPPPVRAPRRR